MGIELIYALLTIVPSVLLVVMVLLGLGHDVDLGGGEVDVGHEFEAGHEMEAGFDADAGGPSAVGVRLILSFVIGFGLAGFLSVHFRWPVHHVLSGFIGGAVVYLLVYQFLRLLYRQQANTLISSASLAGRKGLVTSPIAPGGIGEVRAEDPKTGQTIYLRARAVDPAKVFPSGEEVTIKTVIAGLAKVG